jgi:predicted GNAT family N-acyltransferase/very-short-patch-repair endonuclease
MKKHPATGAYVRGRDLRRFMTEAEKAVWSMLRARQIAGHRFRRQVPLGHYIADFACHQSKLIVEIDGGQHAHASAQEAERNRFLKSQGYRILRFWNNDVLENPEGVWLAISTALTENHPHPTLPHRGGGLSPGPLPKAGGQVGLEWRHFGDFSATELYEVLRFRQAIFVVEQASPYPDLDGKDRRAEHLLLWRDGALAGCLRLISDAEHRRVAVGRVAVAAPLRRQGLARLMMAGALVRARRDCPDCTVTLTAQTHLAPFYASLGFRPVSEPFDDYGVPHVEMAL